jgi:hypothetical protein
MIDVVRKEPDQTTFVAEGALSADELLTAYSHYLAAGPSHRTLWDLTSARFVQIDAGAIRGLARRIAEAGRGRRPAGRAALVCGPAVEGEMARLLATYLSIEKYVSEVAVFADADSADTWLKGEPGE